MPEPIPLPADLLPLVRLAAARIREGDDVETVLIELVRAVVRKPISRHAGLWDDATPTVEIDADGMDAQARPTVRPKRC